MACTLDALASASTNVRVRFFFTDTHQHVLLHIRESICVTNVSSFGATMVPEHSSALSEYTVVTTETTWRAIVAGLRLPAAAYAVGELVIHGDGGLLGFAGVFALFKRPNTE